MAFRPIPFRRSRVTFAATLLLLAWMPSLLFFGHWSALASPSPHQAMTVAAHHEAGTPTEDSQHALHCHGSSSCADQGGAASALDLVASNPLALVTRPLEVVTTGNSPSRFEGRSSARPDAPPPRMAA
jgi:hypothetical protein